MQYRGAPSRRWRSPLLPLLLLSIFVLSLLLAVFHLRPWDRREPDSGLPSPSPSAVVTPESGFSATHPPPMDVSAFLSYQRQAFRTLYLSDGRILFALRDENDYNFVSSVVLIDAEGNLLWSTPVSPSFAHDNAGLAQLADGSFAFLSYLREGATPTRVLLLGQDGTLRGEVPLPDWALTPYLYDGGVFARTDSGIVKFTLDGKEAFRLDQPYYPFMATRAGDRTYFTGWRYANDTFYGAVLCLDDAGDLLWRFADEREAHGWCITADGGLLFDVVASDASGVQDYLYRMDASGNVLWRKQVSPYGVVHLMEELPDGSFEIYGAVSEESGPYYSYRLRLDAHGNHLESIFKTQWGQCCRYVEGQVYAVVYEDVNNRLQPVDFLPFDAMADQQRAPFVLQ